MLWRRASGGMHARRQGGWRLEQGGDDAVVGVSPPLPPRATGRRRSAGQGPDTPAAELIGVTAPGTRIGAYPEVTQSIRKILVAIGGGPPREKRLTPEGGVARGFSGRRGLVQ